MHVINTVTSDIQELDQEEFRNQQEIEKLKTTFGESEENVNEDFNHFDLSNNVMNQEIEVSSSTTQPIVVDKLLDMTTEHHSMDVIEPVSQSTSDLPTLEIPLDETNDYLEREYRASCVAESELRFGPMILNLEKLLLEITAVLGYSCQEVIHNLFKVCEVQLTSDNGATVPMVVAQSLINILGQLDLLSVDMLRLFRNLPLAFLNFNNSSTPIQDLLSVLSLPNSFYQLQSLNLSNTKLKESSLHNLSHLPLTRLNLSTTNLTKNGIIHILAFRFTLLELKIAHNLTIDNESLPLINLLHLLTTLDIFRTSITFEGELNIPPSPSYGLRNFITRASILQPDLIAISPPLDALRLILSLNIPPLLPPLISNPDQVDEMDDVPTIKKHILLLNPQADVRAQKKNLQKRLSFLLYRRSDNLRCVEMMQVDKIRVAAKKWEG